MNPARVLNLSGSLAVYSSSLRQAGRCRQENDANDNGLYARGTPSEPGTVLGAVHKITPSLLMPTEVGISFPHLHEKSEVLRG